MRLKAKRANFFIWIFGEPWELPKRSFHYFDYADKIVNLFISMVNNWK